MKYQYVLITYKKIAEQFLYKFIDIAPPVSWPSQKIKTYHAAELLLSFCFQQLLISLLSYEQVGRSLLYVKKIKKLLTICNLEWF